MAAVTHSDFGIVKSKKVSIDASNITIKVGERLITYPSMTIDHTYTQQSSTSTAHIYSESTVFSDRFAYLEMERKANEIALQIFDEKNQLLKRIERRLEVVDGVKVSFWNSDQVHSVHLTVKVPDERTKQKSAKVLFDYIDKEIVVRTVLSHNNLGN